MHLIIFSRQERAGSRSCKTDTEVIPLAIRRGCGPHKINSSLLQIQFVWLLSQLRAGYVVNSVAPKCVYDIKQSSHV